MMRFVTAVTNRILPLEEAASIKAFSESLSASAPSAAGSTEISPRCGDQDGWEETAFFPALPKEAAVLCFEGAPRAGSVPAGTGLIPAACAPRGAVLSWICPCAASHHLALGWQGGAGGEEQPVPRTCFCAGWQWPTAELPRASGSATETSPACSLWTIAIVFLQCDNGRGPWLVLVFVCVKITQPSSFGVLVKERHWSNRKSRAVTAPSNVMVSFTATNIKLVARCSHPFPYFCAILFDNHNKSIN